MFRVISAFAVAILAISTSFVGVDAVHAQEVESTEVPGIATTEDGSETITTILGGTTQSTDPTRYDYVPPADDGMIRPMDAYGMQLLGGFSYTYKGVTIRIPVAYIAHDVKSKGLVVSKQEALFFPYTPNNFQICNYEWRFQNRKGSSIYSTKWVGKDGCFFGAQVKGGLYKSRSVKTGILCAALYANGEFRGEQCHSVYP